MTNLLLITSLDPDGMGIRVFGSGSDLISWGFCPLFIAQEVEYEPLDQTDFTYG
jgi:hypothetical protein